MITGKRSINEAVDLINEIENAFDVKSLVIEKFHIWPLLRVLLGMQLDNITERKKSTQKAQMISRAMTKSLKLPSDLLKSFQPFLFDRCHNQSRFEKSDAIFLTNAGSRRYQIEGKYFNVYSDPITSWLKQRRFQTLVLESASSNSFKLPRFAHSYCIEHRLIMFNYLSVTRLNNVDIPIQILKKLHAIFEYLKKNDLSEYIPDILYLKRRICFIRLLADYFKQIIQQTQAKVVFLTSYYSGVGPAMNLACREVGITSVDVQHGVQGRNHLGYGRWNNVPEKGYEVLPKIFWTWGEDERREILKWSEPVSKYHVPIVGGNVEMEFFQGQKITVTKEYTEKIAVVKANDKIQVLITLQFGRSLPEIYKDAITSSSEQVFWWLRFHPISSNEEKQKILRELTRFGTENVNIQEATDCPLLALLGHMDVHVTQNSSVVLEAAHYGIPSIVVHPSGISLYKGREDTKKVGLWLCEKKHLLLEKILELGKLPVLSG